MIPEIIKLTCRKLRNNSTKAEIILWNYLKWKQLWYKFLRQYPLYVYSEYSWLDRYIIPDFYCKERKFIIEIDWSIHNNKDIFLLDKYKTKLIKEKWIKIIRITNKDIFNNINKVIIKIKNNL